MKRIFSILFAVVLALSLTLVPSTPAMANTIASSNMVFEGDLTAQSGGVYTGTVNMTVGAYYVAGGGGESISTDGGFDVYAKEGGTAYVEGMTPDNWIIGSDHDAYSQTGPWGSWYDPDCADWYQYSLELTADHWYLRYTATGESPMSGTMTWYGDGTGYAAETDPGTVRNDDGSNPTDPLNRDATRYANGSAQEWGWNCGWGEERIPLQFPGFYVQVTAGGSYVVTLAPSTGLVGLWHFDEGGGTTTSDSSGNGNTGTLTNGPTWVSGKFGNALSFDGVNNYVHINDSLSLDITGPITVEAWVKFNSLAMNKDSVIARKGLAYSLQKYTDNKLEGWVMISGTWYGVRGISGGTTLTYDQWYHLAFTYDGTNVRTYVNGSLDRVGAVVGNIDATAGNASIGTDLEGHSAYTAGIIDEVRIWNGALSSTAIQQSYQLGGSQSSSPVVVQLGHKVLTSGEVVCFTSAFHLGKQTEETDKTVDIFLMSSSGGRTIDDVGLRRVTPGNTSGNLDSENKVSDTHWTADVTNGMATGKKSKTSTSIHLYAELDTLERLGVNAQYLPWD